MKFTRDSQSSPLLIQSPVYPLRRLIWTHEVALRLGQNRRFLKRRAIFWDPEFGTKAKLENQLYMLTRAPKQIYLLTDEVVFVEESNSLCTVGIYSSFLDRPAIYPVSDDASTWQNIEFD